MDNALQVAPVQLEEFQAQASYDGSQVNLLLKGNADIRAMFPLESLLKQLKPEVSRLKARQVVVDLRSLEFMNSSCFKSFVMWLGHVQELEPEQQYTIRFLSDPTKHWQGRSLNALSCFAVDLVRIEN
jgi:hypothetical protein